MTERRIFWLTTLLLFVWQCSTATCLSAYANFGRFGSSLTKAYSTARPLFTVYMPKEIALMGYCLDNREHLVCRQLFHVVREFSATINDRQLLKQVSLYDDQKDHVRRLAKRQDLGVPSPIIATLRQPVDPNQEREILYRGTTYCPCKNVPAAASSCQRPIATTTVTALCETTIPSLGQATTTVTVLGNGVLPTCTYGTAGFEGGAPAMSHGRPPRTTVTKYAPSSCSATTTVTSTVSITTLSPKELKSFCSEIYSTMTCGQPTPRTTLSRTRSQHIVTPPALSLPTSPPSISSLIGETSERTMNSDSSVSLSSWSISGSPSNAAPLSSSAIVLPPIAFTSSDLPVTAPSAPASGTTPAASRQGTGSISWSQPVPSLSGSTDARLSTLSEDRPSTPVIPSTQPASSMSSATCAHPSNRHPEASHSAPAPSASVSSTQPVPAQSGSTDAHPSTNSEASYSEASPTTAAPSNTNPVEVPAPAETGRSPSNTAPSPIVYTSPSGTLVVSNTDVALLQIGSDGGAPFGVDYELSLHHGTTEIVNTTATPTPSTPLMETPASDAVTTPTAATVQPPFTDSLSTSVPTGPEQSSAAETTAPHPSMQTTPIQTQSVTTVVQIVSTTTTLPPATITTTSPQSTTTYCYQMPQGGPVTCLLADQVPTPTPPVVIDHIKQEEEDDCETDDWGHVVYATDSNVEEHEKHWKDGSHKWKWKKHEDQESEEHRDDEDEGDDEDDDEDDGWEQNKEWKKKKDGHWGHKKKGKWDKSGRGSSSGKKNKIWNKKKKGNKMNE